MSDFLQEPADGNSQAAWDCSEMFSAPRDLEELKDDKSRLPQAVGGVVLASGISLALMAGTAHAEESTRSESAAMQPASSESNTPAKNTNTKSQRDASGTETTKPAPEARTNASPPDSSKLAAATREVVTENNEPKPSSPLLQTGKDGSHDKKTSAPTPVTIKTTVQNSIKPASKPAGVPAVDTSPNTPSNDGSRVENTKVVASPIDKSVQKPSVPDTRNETAPVNASVPVLPVQPGQVVVQPEAPKQNVPLPSKIVASPAKPGLVAEAPTLIDRDTESKQSTPPAIFTIPAPTIPKPESNGSILTGVNTAERRLVPPAIISFVPSLQNVPAEKAETPLPAEAAASPAPPPPPEAPAPPPPPPEPPKERRHTLAGETFVKPLDNFVVTSEFGMRKHPIKRKRAMHNGIDLAAPYGTPVKAMQDGKVVEVGHDKKGYGKFIVIDHGDAARTLYGHLSTIDVVEGQTVEIAQPIGGVGSTGGSTGNHLHLEHRAHDRPVPNTDYVLKGKPWPGEKAPDPEPAPPPETVPETTTTIALPLASVPPTGDLPLSRGGSSSGASINTRSPASPPPMIFYARPIASGQPLFTAADVSSTRQSSVLAANIGSSKISSPKMNTSTINSRHHPLIPAIVTSPATSSLPSPAPRVTTPLSPVSTMPEAPTATVPIQEAFTPPASTEPVPAPSAVVEKPTVPTSEAKEHESADPVERVWNYLTKELGPEARLTPQQAAGVMGNFQVESGFDFGIQERKPLAGRGGYGVAQWTGNRRVALEAEAKRLGVPVSDWRFQMDYMFRESNSRRSIDNKNISEWEGLRRQTTAKGSMKYWLKNFERAGIPHTQKRLQAANEILARFSR